MWSTGSVRSLAGRKGLPGGRGPGEGDAHVFIVDIPCSGAKVTGACETPMCVTEWDSCIHVAREEQVRPTAGSCAMMPFPSVRRVPIDGTCLWFELRCSELLKQSIVGNGALPFRTSESFLVLVFRLRIFI